MATVTCEACRTPFTAQRADARFCSPACRQQAHRDRVAADAEPVEDGPLVAAVVAELRGLRSLDSPHGQLAVALARGIERRPTAGLSQQLREVLAQVRVRPGR